MANIILLFTLLISCAPLKQETKKRLVEVNYHLVICQGESTQWCMQVKYKNENSWQYYYDRIEKFNYNWGTTYLLEIEETKVADAAQDASSIKWVLRSVIKKTKVPANTHFELDLGQERASFDTIKNKIIILDREFSISKKFPLSRLSNFKIICFRFSGQNKVEAYDGREI